MISYMEIWLAATDGDMVKVDKFTYLYRLKESKEYGYYELVPWTKEARIVKDLPLSFKYWKSRFFFMSREELETSSDEVWGDLPRLLRQWRISRLGASSLLLVLHRSFFPIYILSSLILMIVLLGS